MSIKKIINDATTTLFDFLGDEGQKIKNFCIPKKRSKKKKKSKNTHNQIEQLDLFSLAANLNNKESSSNIKNSDKKKSSECNAHHNEPPVATQYSLFDLSNDINESNLEPTNKIFKDIIPAPTYERKTSSSPAAENYKISASDKLGEGSLKEKCQDNVVSIETLQKVESSNRPASKEEQKKLIKFVGWGGLAQNVFAEKVKQGWEFLARKVKNLLSDTEYEAASRSSLTAFYTPRELITFIYHALDKMGFTGGRILEPSCGIGHFIGCMPDKLKSRTRLTGVELDSISARIAKLLYPKSKIYNKGFEECNLDDNSFDLVFGNIPFGDFKVYDKKYDKLNFKIHNYFFAKSLDLVRNGGIVAFITSHYTMDSKSDIVRKYISKRANLIAAVRLPINAFKSANTQIVADIIFLQKKHLDENYTGELWLSLEEKNGAMINEYYVAHPEMIMGKLGLSKHTNQYNQYEMIVETDEDVSTLLNSVLRYIPKNIYNEISLSSTYLFEDDELLSINDYPNIKENSYELIQTEDQKEKLYQRQGNNLVPVLVNSNVERRIKGLIEVKKALEDVINFQVHNENGELELKRLQNNLTNKYDSFKRFYNHINSLENKKAFEEDPSYPLLSSLEVQQEDGSFEKADIFTKRTISYEAKIYHTDSIDDALTISLNRNLEIDFEFMANLTGNSIDEIKAYLLDKQLIFKNPSSGQYEPADEYLSGPVVEKLKTAKKLSPEDREFKYNVSALTNVQPIPLDCTEIDVKLGSAWVPSKYIKDFMIYILAIDSSEIEKFNVLYSRINASWEISIPKGTLNINNYQNHSLYGTTRISALKLLSLSLNLKEAKVYDSVWDADKDKYVSKLNDKETTFARQKQSELKAAFKDWIWEDKNRRKVLTDLYNNLFNSWVNRKYDGSKLDPKGLSVQAPKLRDYQANAIMRVLYSGNTLLAHCVGSGKTMEMVISGMEMKRMGLCKKPMYVIPNALVESGQFAREFMQLYPTANILVATSKDFQASKRKRFISRIALCEWDAVIIGHSSFGLIPVSNETQAKFIKAEIKEIIAVLQSLDDDDSRTAKRLEKTKASLEQKLKAMLDSHKDNLLNFEQLGIDTLFVDEAHNFKKLFLFSKLSNISGVPSSPSNKAFDMYVKIHYLCQKNKENGKGYRGAVFATGTPISNSMAEVFVMQKFLMPNELKRIGLDYFDSWASTFGEIVSSIEINATGTGYRTRLKFSKFNNIPELMSIFGRIADIVTSEMINIPGKPKLDNGYTDVQISKCPEVEEFIQSLIDRAEAIHDGRVRPEQDNMLCVVNDGKKVALDPRLVGINVDLDDSKINTCVKNIFNEWKNGAEERTDQLIFCDMGTPKKSKSNIINLNNFNVYDDIKRKLIKLGVPKNEIAFIHDADSPIKKKNLFRDFKAGKVRILIGSTSKCGEGANIQDRLAVLHHLDCPWRPSDLEQREGRILRVGNTCKHPKIYRYATKGTFDGYSWQTVETKAKFINQIMRGNFKGRSIEDIDEQLMSFAQMKAICSENPLIAEKIKNDIEVQKLQALKTGYRQQKYYAENKIDSNSGYIEVNQNYIKRLYQDVKLRNDNKKSEFEINIKDRVFKPHINSDGNSVTGKKDAGEYIVELFEELDYDSKVPIGSFNGFQLFIAKVKSFSSDNGYKEETLYAKGAAEYPIECTLSTGLGLIQRLENTLTSLDTKITEIELNIKTKQAENEGFKETLSQPFKFEDKLNNLIKRQAELDSILDLNHSSSTIDDEQEKSSVAN